jgi:hypothetical protein
MHWDVVLMPWYMIYYEENNVFHKSLVHMVNFYEHVMNSFNPILIIYGTLTNLVIYLWLRNVCEVCCFVLDTPKLLGESILWGAHFGHFHNVYVSV